MTLYDFVAIARAYQTIDCATADERLVEKAFNLMQFSYAQLSDKDKDAVNIICDARLTDLFE